MSGEGFGGVVPIQIPAADKPIAVASEACGNVTGKTMLVEEML